MCIDDCAFFRYISCYKGAKLGDIKIAADTMRALGYQSWDTLLSLAFRPKLLNDRWANFYENDEESEATRERERKHGNRDRTTDFKEMKDAAEQTQKQFVAYADLVTRSEGTCKADGHHPIYPTCKKEIIAARWDLLIPPDKDVTADQD